MKNIQTIHQTVTIMEGAVISGAVTIGANTYIGSGAIISSNGGTIEIGDNTVIMEGAIIRSSKKFGCSIGNHVIIGPKATITGSIIDDYCFIATNGTIFHGSKLKSGTILAINGIIHIDTFCPEDTFIPINHIAFGNPAKIYAPSEIGDFHQALKQIGFVKYVYDIDTSGLSNSEIYKKMTAKFLANLDK
ncbi:gamma carbonic anhydrase family protein [Flavobacterium soyangense]|uniref:Gamma carbonic anhydrase family protein n=1 Tax=Flavobacterium soyangense TaxID=2023265 RepID=A0A930UCQ4_9FLAO|nr:gamma carbonic anhydrase family protein [Flavobacterium soyangense]MBF2707995.1 gamma carbonic anhydrase family protein [Flavobacterium soyangense]